MNFRDATHALLFCGGYFAAAEVGHALSFPGNFASLWPPSGLYLAALLLVNVNRWPWFIAAALMGNIVSDVGFHDKTIPVSLSFWLANTLEAVSGSLALRLILGSSFNITRLRNAVWFMVVTPTLGTVVGASIGAAVVVSAFGGDYWSAWCVWWQSSVLGILLFTPPLVNFINCKPWKEPGWGRRILEATVMVGVVCLAGWYVFRLQTRPLPFITLPIIMWASVRLRVSGAVLATLALAGVAVWNTSLGYGPFAGDRSIVEQVLLTQGFLGVSIVISLTLATLMMEHDESRRKLELLATVDGLTGLFNRRAFDDRLEAETARSVRQGYSLSLLVLDIDFFKQINDTLGHPAGDEILKQMGALLRKTARNCDFVARTGGEEFSVLLPDTDEHQSIVAGERFRRAVAEYHWAERPITVSVGAATLSSESAADVALVRGADAALYESKNAGRNVVTHVGIPRQAEPVRDCNIHLPKRMALVSDRCVTPGPC